MAGLDGLLGSSLDDPKTLANFAAIQGLLSGRGLNQGIASGLLARGQYLQQAKQQEESQKARAIQLQMQQMALQQAQEAQQKQAAIDQAYRSAMRTPQQMAMQANGGPTNAAAQAIPNTPPSVDQGALIRSLMQADPQAAYQMLQPKAPEYKTVGNALVQVGPGGVKEAYRAPDKPEAPPSSVREFEYSLANPAFAAYQERLKKAGAGNTQVSYGTPVAALDADGNPVFIQPAKGGGAPAVIPGMRPPKSAAEERADQERLARERTGKQMLSALSDAESILKSGRATGSGVGNVVDAGARMVGVSTPGAQDAARLESLSGWLVSNVPRMEGPQSNYDVQNYMTMAGKIGDRTTPIPERLAALSEVRRLQQKYASINGTPQTQEPAAPTNGVRRYNPATGKLE